MSEKKYITTPIYYVNDVPHIGHAYTTIAADVLARYYRAQGDEVFFLTGTDEHGAKIAEAAAKAGMAPKDFVDSLVPKFQNAWSKLNISNDQFIRTTDPGHEKVVQEFVKRLSDSGFVEKKSYRGLYCVGCERFLQPDELADGKCPDHNRVPEEKSEENYFFQLSKFGDRILAAIEMGEIVIAPESRRNEVVGKIKKGLEDVSISRGEVSWGIAYPGDDKQTIYVWVDALINYYSATRIYSNSQRLDTVSNNKEIATPSHNGEWLAMTNNSEATVSLVAPEERSGMKQLNNGSAPQWPANLHLMAKDILWFHAVIWPAMLMAVGEALPKKVYAHGFFTIGGKKMSKSLGNTLDPVALAEKYGSDAVRYCLLREFPFGEDGDISEEKIAARYVSDLANGLGNLLNRTLNMINKYQISNGRGHNNDSEFRLRIYRNSDDDFLLTDDDSLEIKLPSFKARCYTKIENLLFDQALSDIWLLIHTANKMIDKEKPWELFPNNKDKLNDLLSFLYVLLESLADLVEIFMPETAEKMKKQLKTLEPEPLFPRL